MDWLFLGQQEEVVVFPSNTMFWYHIKILTAYGHKRNEMSLTKEQLQKGDYVIATKYDDGDPKDHFAVGFFDSMTWHNRYNIVTSEGELFRHNGFRKVKKISQEVGTKIVSNIKNIEQSDRSVWDWVSKFENN